MFFFKGESEPRNTVHSLARWGEFDTAASVQTATSSRCHVGSHITPPVLDCVAGLHFRRGCNRSQSDRINGHYLAIVYGDRGRAYQKKGDNELAIQDLNHAIELDPNDPDSFYLRGLAYQNKGDNDRAIQDYNHAIAVAPSNPHSFANRGVAYQSKGDNDRAIQDYDHAIALDPNEPLTFTNRGNAYRAKGEYDRAIQDYDKALQLNSNYGLAFVNRGVAYALKETKVKLSVTTTSLFGWTQLIRSISQTVQLPIGGREIMTLLPRTSTKL